MNSANERWWDEYSDDEWKRILLSIKDYARYKCKFLPPDLEPDDIACEALRKVLEGSRKWNMAKYPDIIDLLKSVVNSILSNMWKLHFNKNRMRETKAVSNMDVIDGTVSNEEEKQALLECFNEKIEEFKIIIKGDEELENIILAAECGCSSNDEVCELLGWDKKKLYNAKKRLRSKIKKYRKQQ